MLFVTLADKRNDRCISLLSEGAFEQVFLNSACNKLHNHSDFYTVLFHFQGHRRERNKKNVQTVFSGFECID